MPGQEEATPADSKIAGFGNSTYYGTRRRKVPMVTAVLGQIEQAPD